jgi:hypothetical protein
MLDPLGALAVPLSVTSALDPFVARIIALLAGLVKATVGIAPLAEVLIVSVVCVLPPGPFAVQVHEDG